MTKEDKKRAYEILMEMISAFKKSDDNKIRGIEQVISASNKEVQNMVKMCLDNEFLTEKEIIYVLGLGDECPDDIRRIM